MIYHSTPVPYNVSQEGGHPGQEYEVALLSLLDFKIDKLRHL
jgi:hypothetical protein